MLPENWYQIIPPKSVLLKKYIVNFYVHNDIPLEGNCITYYAYPQSGTDISLCNGAQLDFTGNEVTWIKNDSQKPFVIFLRKYLNPIKVNYKDSVQKITIHFSETGVINFFPNYYGKFEQNLFRQWDLGNFGLIAQKLFSKNIEEGLAYLENYLLSIFSPNSLSSIERAVEIIKGNLSIPTAQVAETIAMNKKTFARQFKKHVGCTTSDFKRITRFKKTARSYFSGRHSNLLQLCLDNGYYDASDFYKQISRTTSLKPKDFFNNVKKIGAENGIYIFE